MMEVRPTEGFEQSLLEATVERMCDEVSLTLTLIVMVLVRVIAIVIVIAIFPGHITYPSGIWYWHL